MKRVTDEGASDADVLSLAADNGWVLLTRDKSDFPEQEDGDHAGILVITREERTGGELREAVHDLLDQYPDLSGEIAYVSDWVE